MSQGVRVERLISGALRAGVVVGALFVAAGVILLAATGSTGYSPVPSLAQLHAFQASDGPGHFPVTPLAVLAGVVHGKPYAIIELGILVLMSTPVLRVTLSVGFFAAQRDRLYVVITLAVLAVLVLSYLLGGVG